MKAATPTRDPQKQFSISIGIRIASFALCLLLARQGTSRGDNLYVANYNDSTIEKFDSSGVGTVFASSGLNVPIFLAFDSAGNP